MITVKYFNSSKNKFVKDSSLKIFRFELSQRETEAASFTIQIISSNNYLGRELMIFYEEKAIAKGRCISIENFDDITELLCICADDSCNQQFAECISLNFEKINALFDKKFLYKTNKVIEWDRVSHKPCVCDFFPKSPIKNITQFMFKSSLHSFPSIKTLNFKINSKWDEEVIESVNLFQSIANQFKDRAINTDKPRVLEKSWPKPGARHDRIWITNSYIRPQKNIKPPSKYPQKQEVNIEEENKPNNNLDHNEKKLDDNEKSNERVFYEGALSVLYSYNQNRLDILNIIINNEPLKGEIQRDLEINIQINNHPTNGNKNNNKDNNEVLYEKEVIDKENTNKEIIDKEIIDCATNIAYSIIQGSNRCADIEIEIPFVHVFDITTKDTLSVTINDKVFVGKVTYYQYVVTCEYAIAIITISCGEERPIKMPDKLIPIQEANAIPKLEPHIKVDEDKPRIDISLKKNNVPRTIIRSQDFL